MLTSGYNDAARGGAGSCLNGNCDQKGTILADQPAVLLSAFADEGAISKTAVEQFSTLSALGLSYYSPRFIDVMGSGTIKHVTELNDAELSRLVTLQADYGMQVCSIGSRLGKVKLTDQDDGSHNRYVEPQQYLKGEVAATIRVAQALGAKLVRGFSFYHPRGEDAWGSVTAAARRLEPIVDACAEAGLVYGLEVEANLVGQTGRLLAAIAGQLARPNLVCIFDGANLTCQNIDAPTCFAEYVAMRDSFGWMHIKDYRIDPTLQWTGVVDEERLKNFVPADEGDSDHRTLLADLKQYLPIIQARMERLGVPGVFLELEPHLKGGGQFGGFSGPDGLGVALRGLLRVLDEVGIGYHLRDFADIRRARGF